MWDRSAKMRTPLDGTPRVLAEVTSLPLDSLASEINRRSLNLGAELLLQWAGGREQGPANLMAHIQQVTGQGAGNYSGLFVNYSAGPLGLGMAWEKVKSTQAPALPSSISQTLWGFAGSYDLGMLKLYGLYNKGTISTSGANDKGWGFGVVVPVSSMTLNVGYGREKTQNAAGLNDKNTAFGASLHYPLSKRTRIYGEFMNGKITAGGGVNTQKDSNVGMGLIHNF